MNLPSTAATLLMLTLMASANAADPLSVVTQHAYIKASDPGVQDNFGYSVAVSGDTMAIGAPYADGASGELESSGAVYLFERGSTSWQQSMVLEAPNAGAGDRFGWSVALSEDTLVVGAVWEDSGSEKMEGQSEESGRNTGAAYVFVRGEGGWELQAFLKATEIRDTDEFGFSVAVDGDTIVVGAPLHDGSQQDVGAVYMFRRSGDSWSEDGASFGSETRDQFGRSVAVDGDNFIVGAPGEDPFGGGAVHIFVRQESGWERGDRIAASNQGFPFLFGNDGDRFGHSVGISDGTIVVGAHLEPSRSLGGVAVADGSGAVYVFVQGDGGWVEQAYLKASNAESFDKFGWSVAIEGDLIAVSARDEDGGSSGIDGDGMSNVTSLSGSTYLFSRFGTDWSECAYIKSSNTDVGDQFGWSVALSGATLVVSAHEEDSSATGIDGPGASNGTPRSGAAYVFAPPRGRLFVLKEFTRENGETRLTVPRMLGRRIGVEYSPDLTPGSWVDLGNFSNTGRVAKFIDFDLDRSGAERGFYRAFLRP